MTIAARPTLGVLLLVCVYALSAGAHDSWISSGGFKNNAGEWCCGENDCTVLSENEVREQAGGYRVSMPASNQVGRQTAVDELVPFPEATPSPDGAYWRCRRPDGTRRCFFAPPPNT